MPSCKSCGRPVLWYKTAAGKNMPLDPQPVFGGNIVIHHGPKMGEAHVTVEKPEPEVLRFVSHFVTCPNAASHRRKS